MKKLFSTIIVTYNNENTIKDCLDSLLKLEEDVEVIVVDNNSSDDTLGILKEYKEKIRVVGESTNLGFAKGNNLGENFSAGEYLVFLNPDTKLLKKNDLTNIVTICHNNPGFGLIGPKLVGRDGQEQKTVRNLPTILRAFCEYILGIKGSYDFYMPEENMLVSVESVVGACMVIRKDIFEKAGKFNERYFLYYEDLRLCQDVLNLGYKVGFLPSITLQHNIGASGKKMEVSRLLINSSKIYHGWLSYYLITFIIRLSQLFKK